MQYAIIENHLITELIKDVNRHIKDGWEPIGGMTINTKREHPTYYQTMIRK